MALTVPPKNCCGGEHASPCPTNLWQTIVSKTCKHKAHDGSHLQDTCCNPARTSYHAGVIQTSVDVSECAFQHCLHLFLAIANIEQTCRLCWQTVQNTFSDLDQKNVHNDANPMTLHAPNGPHAKKKHQNKPWPANETCPTSTVSDSKPYGNLIAFHTRTNDAIQEVPRQAHAITLGAHASERGTNFCGFKDQEKQRSDGRWPVCRDVFLTCCIGKKATCQGFIAGKDTS